MAPKHHAEVLSSVPECKKPVSYPKEKDKLRSDTGYTAVVISSMLLNRQSVLNAVS